MEEIQVACQYKLPLHLYLGLGEIVLHMVGNHPRLFLSLDLYTVELRQHPQFNFFLFKIWWFCNWTGSCFHVFTHRAVFGLVPLSYVVIVFFLDIKHFLTAWQTSQSMANPFWSDCRWASFVHVSQLDVWNVRFVPVCRSIQSLEASVDLYSFWSLIHEVTDSLLCILATLIPPLMLSIYQVNLLFCR